MTAAVEQTFHLACDLGAESGRVMLGTLQGPRGRMRLALAELHRFPTGALEVNGTLRWDFLRIWGSIVEGLRKAGTRGEAVSSISTDSWGVDYVLGKGDEPMLIAPFHYRDQRTAGGYERVAAKIPLAEVFNETGIQFMLINAIYQLEADMRIRPDIIRFAERMLGVGDQINWLLSGVAKMEVSMASTFQIYNPRTRTWSEKIIKALDFPKHIFPELVDSGTVLAALRPALATATGLAPETKIVAGCSHDTGAAVAAVPAADEGEWAYLSSGTWSLLGIESPVPIINEASRAKNFTNEAGYGGTTRFLKNISGLWILQECRRNWIASGKATADELSYEKLAALAADAKPLQTLINPADVRFGLVTDMPARIAEYCKETGQAVPANFGATVRCILESLALSYRRTLGEITAITGKKPQVLHIVGGGTKNLLLNQLAADATGMTVIAGPVEATAAGNVLIQALALGRLSNLAEARAVVRASFPLTTYQPRDAAAWQAAYSRFQDLP